MKQVKFLFVALMAIVMSVSVTSCMNTDNNTQVSNQPIIGKVKENFLNLIFTSMDGYTFHSKNTVTNASNLSAGDFIVAACTYDTEVDVDYSKNTIQATIGAVEKISGNRVHSTTKAEDTGSNPAFASDRGVISISDYHLRPIMLDNDNILIPIQYFAEEKVSSHTFSLVYYTDESEMKNKSELKLYLRHKSTENKDKETRQAFSYRVFNVREAISTFKRVSGNYPTKIVVVSENNASNNDVPKTTITTSIDYKYKE